jgi:hypothetical protein
MCPDLARRMNARATDTKPAYAGYPMMFFIFIKGLDAA